MSLEKTVEEYAVDIRQIRNSPSIVMWEIFNEGVASEDKDDEQVPYDVTQQKVIGPIGKPGTFSNPEGDVSLSANGKMFANGASDENSNVYTVYRRTDDKFVIFPPFSRGPYGNSRMRPAGQA